MQWTFADSYRGNQGSLTTKLIIDGNTILEVGPMTTGTVKPFVATHIMNLTSDSTVRLNAIGGGYSPTTVKGKMTGTITEQNLLNMKNRIWNFIRPLDNFIFNYFVKIGVIIF